MRTSLRHRREVAEGPTYETGMSLLTEPAVPVAEDFEAFEDSSMTIFLTDLETTGPDRNIDILQIAAQCKNKNLLV